MSVIGALIMIAGTIPCVAIGANTSYVLIELATPARGIGVGLAVMPAMTAAFGVLEPTTMLMRIARRSHRQDAELAAITGADPGRQRELEPA
jgi:hypothetical protein